jgi:hypothetical protein
MNRGSWKFLLIGAVVAVALSSAAPQADAQWWGYSYRPVTWGCCYTPSYSPCYATVSCYSPCGYDSYGGYWGWRPGPVRRLLFGSYRWYWGGGLYAGGCCTTYDTCCTEGPMTAAPNGAPTPAPTPARKPVMDSAVPTEPAAPPAAPAPARAQDQRRLVGNQRRADGLGAVRRQGDDQWAGDPQRRQPASVRFVRSEAGLQLQVHRSGPGGPQRPDAGRYPDGHVDGGRDHRRGLWLQRDVPASGGGSVDHGGAGIFACPGQTGMSA